METETFPILKALAQQQMNEVIYPIAHSAFGKTTRRETKSVILPNLVGFNRKSNRQIVEFYRKLLSK